MSDRIQTLGVIGGGQLGLMFAEAAKAMGHNVVVLEPDPDAPASAVADLHIIKPYDDEAALRKLGVKCDAVTVEFENVPADSLDFLAEYCDVFPSADCFRKTRNRISEKSLALDIGLSTAAFTAIRDEEDLERARKAQKFPAILKTTELGYDGKGQAVVMVPDDLAIAYEHLGSGECILEEKVNLAREISVILGRDRKGNIACFPVAENRHKKGILFMTTVPAEVDQKIENEAIQAAIKLAETLELVGVMAVEFFVTRKNRLLMNEIAPRTHNSGHYTQDATVTSQFEQQVKILLGEPLGSTKLKSPVVMVNLLGDLWRKRTPNFDILSGDSQIQLHLYGKKEARRGRKMGHFNCQGSQLDELKQKAEDYYEKLGGKIN